MFATTACTFVLNFSPNEQTMQKLWAKKHLSEVKGTKKRTSVSCNHPTLIVNVSESTQGIGMVQGGQQVCLALHIVSEVKEFPYLVKFSFEIKTMDFLKSM